MSIYTIKRGKRRIPFLQQFFKFFGFYYNKKKISYCVKFTESCIYNLDTIDNCGVNKVFGLSFGLFGVHKNSARFGWKPKSEKTIMIYAYLYNNSVRTEIKLLEIEINKFCVLKLEVTDKKYIFYCSQSNEVRFEVSHGKISKLSYQNFLYFGGKNVNLKDINIEVEKIYF